MPDTRAQMPTVVKIAAIRKQRLANAAADAARELEQAQARLADAAAVVDEVRMELGRAGAAFSADPASGQLLIWRDRCAAVKAEKIEAHVLRTAEQGEAANILAQNTRALQRQTLRHDHLADLDRRQSHAIRRGHEARADDEQQGSGQQSPGMRDERDLF